MQDLGLLSMQGIQTFRNVKSHSIALFHRQFEGLVHVQQVKQSAAKAELCKYQHLIILAIDAGSHKVD